MWRPTINGSVLARSASQSTSTISLPSEGSATSSSSISAKAKVYVEGRLRKRSYIATDGSHRLVAEVMADNMIMLSHGTETSSARSSVSSGLINDDVALERVAKETMR